MKLKEFMQWLSRLMPRQKMQDVGDGSVQVGRVGGDLTHSQKTMNQTTYNIVVMSAASNTTVETLEQPSQPPDPVPQLVPIAARPKSDATQAQRDLLRLMAQSPAHESLAEAFMRREFNTDRVKKLTTFECLRTTRYLETCMQQGTKRRA